MKRTPLPRRTRPIARATKPLKRTPITKRPTKRKLEIDALLKAAKEFYFKGHHICQRCARLIEKTACAAHHKLKRSLGGGHGKVNLIILCHDCHDWAHDESHPRNLREIRDSRANAENGWLI